MRSNADFNSIKCVGRCIFPVLLPVRGKLSTKSSLCLPHIPHIILSFTVDEFTSIFEEFRNNEKNLEEILNAFNDAVESHPTSEFLKIKEDQVVPPSNKFFPLIPSEKNSKSPERKISSS